MSLEYEPSSEPSGSDSGHDFRVKKMETLEVAPSLLVSGKQNPALKAAQNGESNQPGSVGDQRGPQGSAGGDSEPRTLDPEPRTPDPEP